MKNLKIIFLILFTSFSSYAQDPQLFENTWYLQNFTIDNVIYETPDNFEVAYVALDFIGTIITSSICENGFVEGATYTSTNIFEFAEFDPTTGQCADNDNEMFKNLYFSYYQSGITAPFIYSITTETDQSKTLLITNGNGDEVIYTSMYFDSIPQEILDDTWYLHNLTVDGETSVPPVNSELPFVSLNFIENGFGTGVCNALSGNSFFDIDNSTFITTYSAFTLIECAIEENTQGNLI